MNSLYYTLFNNPATVIVGSYINYINSVCEYGILDLIFSNVTIDSIQDSKF